MSYNTIEDYLEGLFSEVYQVTEVSVPYDRITGRFQEFAFVELTNEGAAAEAIQLFDGYEFRGRYLYVSQAEERRWHTSNYGGGESKAGDYKVTRCSGFIFP